MNVEFTTTELITDEEILSAFGESIRFDEGKFKIDSFIDCLEDRAYFSHKQLEGLNTNQIQELLFQEKGINWNDYPTKFRRGSCCIKKYHQTMNQTLRGYWYIDDEIPIFTGEGRDYIEKLI